MTVSKNIIIENELTLRNAESVKRKIMDKSGNGTPVNLKMKNISDMDFAGVQLILSALLSNYIKSVSVHKMHPELEKLIVNTGFDPIIKNIK